jgi:hypothetical protein
MRDYLGPDFNPDSPPSVVTHARSAGFTGELNPDAVYKSERYAAIGSLTWKMTGDHLLTGFGEEATFQNIEPGTMNDIDVNVGDAFLAAYEATISDPNDERGAHLVNRVRMVERAGATALIFIGSGGTAVSEIKNFNTYVPRAIANNPITRRMPLAGRVALGHMFTAASLSRAGSHIDTLHSRPKWLNLTQQTMVKTTRQVNPTKGQDAVHLLLRSDGRQLFSMWEEIYEMSGPLIKCPVHQNVYGDGTALASILHAGVNEAAKRGAYRLRQ